MFQGRQSRRRMAMRWLLALIAMIGASLWASRPDAASQQAVGTPSTPANDAQADARARETEQKMTDEERFSLIISLLGPVPSLGVPRDKRIPESMKNTSAGYTPGIARLGIL